MSFLRANLKYGLRDAVRKNRIVQYGVKAGTPLLQSDDGHARGIKKKGANQHPSADHVARFQ